MLNGLCVSKQREMTSRFVSKCWRWVGIDRALGDRLQLPLPTSNALGTTITTYILLLKLFFIASISRPSSSGESGEAVCVTTPFHIPPAPPARRTMGKSKDSKGKGKAPREPNEEELYRAGKIALGA